MTPFVTAATSRGTALLGVALLGVLLATPVAADSHVPEIFLYVNDLTSPRLLLYDEWSDLEDLAYEIDSLTSAEVGILIVNDTAGQGIDNFAIDTFNANGIGKAGLDNGVLVVVSIDEAHWRIEVGRGLEYVLNDAKVGRIGREYLEPIAANLTWLFLAQGLYDTVLDIGIEIEENYEAARPNKPQPWKADWTPILAGIAVSGVIAVLTKGRVVMSPGLFTGRRGITWKRGSFGGGSSGGGGARGWFKK